MSRHDVEKKFGVAPWHGGRAGGGLSANQFEDGANQSDSAAVPSEHMLGSAELEALARRVMDGDRRAENELVRHTRFALWMILVRRGCPRDEADDVVQESLMVALRRLRDGDLDDPAKISGYLYRTALFIHRGAQRKAAQLRTVHDPDHLEEFEDGDADPLAEIDRGQRQQLLQRCLSWLGQPRDRELLRRHYLLEEDKEQVCERLGLSLDHFDRVLHRARQRLAELMRPWVK